MADQATAAITIRKLTKSYHSRGKTPITAVEQLNLEIAHGQVFGFLGANGAGKTTTIKMMCGLVTPTAGTIYLNGYDVQTQRGHAMRQIGAVLEGTRNIYWRLTAWENVLYFGRLKGVGSREVTARAEQLLTELDLWDRRHEKTRTFSRGMQQKVAIACALIADPPIVLLDEPTLGLDVEAALTVKNWIVRLATERQKTIVLTTHHLSMAQQVCERVAIINKGKLIANGATQSLLSQFRDEYVEIKVAGTLDGAQAHYEPQWTISMDGDNTYCLSGALTSQDALYRTLTQLREDGLALISIMPIKPDLEALFIDAIQRKTTADRHRLQVEAST